MVMIEDNRLIKLKLIFFILYIGELNIFLFFNLIGTIVTNPCKPVEAQKAEPYTPSAIVNPASEYS